MLKKNTSVEYTGGYFFDCGIGKDILSKTLKAFDLEENIDKFGY